MYFSALKRLIGSVEEKMFYDVAIMFLGAQGYKDLSVVDGAGDGGRDVTCSRSDLRIQLSVRKDWENKLNYEAAVTSKAGKRHFIYVTNRPISPDARAEFFANRFKMAGEVEISIYDLNQVATTLAQSGVISKAYQMLGVTTDVNLNPSPKEIALSSILLFGSEAKELRERVIEANICATLLDQPSAVSEAELVGQVSTSLPGVNLKRAMTAAISRLRSSGSLLGPASAVALSDQKKAQLIAARTDFTKSLSDDVQRLMKVTGLSNLETTVLLAKARELIVRNRDFEEEGVLQEDVRYFLASKKLTAKRREIYGCLASCSTIRQFQFGATIDRIFATNTFDIYRALGGRTEVTMVFDTSVALPLLLGLEFKASESRYGLAVAALEQVCRDHGIKMLTPSVYVNEMAAHGRKALEFLEIYPVLPDDIQQLFRNSRNAYLSHYAHLSESTPDKISLDEFLAHFGIRPGTALRRIENRLMSLLDLHGISSGFTSWYEQSVRDEIEERKPNELRVIVDHDAAVCTTLLQNNKEGYIFATWDNVLIDTVQDLARVFADNPARINDTLSIVEGADFDNEQSQDLLFTLLHVEQQAALKLTEKLEHLESVEQAYRFRAFIEEARRRSGADWQLDEAKVQQFFDTDAAQPNDVVAE